MMDMDNAKDILDGDGYNVDDKKNDWTQVKRPWCDDDDHFWQETVLARTKRTHNQTLPSKLREGPIRVGVFTILDRLEQAN